jgi:hypothetical protein
MLEHGRVGQVAGRQLEDIEQIEDAPDADPQPVIAPGEVALVGRRGVRRQLKSGRSVIGE